VGRVFVCLFYQLLSQKTIAARIANLTYKCHMMSPRISLIFGSKVLVTTSVFRQHTIFLLLLLHT